MSELTANARAQVAGIAARHGVGTATAERLAAALARSGGGQVQFNEPEIGGLGQWSRGGMVMVGDMFDNALKARVDALCTDLSALVAAGGVLVAASSTDGAGWPAELGRIGASGAQNDIRYAVFPETRRLAVARGAKVTVYDTGEHRIGGVAQAQGGDASLTFTSQLGPVRLADLAVAGARAANGATDTPAPAPAPAPERSAADTPEPVDARPRETGGDILATIERLAELAARGILTDEEFARKKADLLDRL